MNTCTIGIRTTGERFINYDYLSPVFPEDTEVITITQIQDSDMERIKNATYEEVQKILSYYISDICNRNQ